VPGVTSPEGGGAFPSRGRRLAQPTGLGPRFRMMYVGAAVGLLGQYVAYLTLPLLVLQIVGSDNAVPFSVTYTLETIPTLVFGLVGGVLLDRVRLRGAMIIANVARAAAFFYLAVNVDEVGLPTVFVSAFLVGSFAAVYENSLYAVLPSLVPAEKLALANGRIATAQAVMFASGPVLAGGLAMLAGPGPGLALTGVSFVISAVCMYLIGAVPRRRTDGQDGFVEETLNGLRFLVGERRLRDSTITAAAANLVFGFIEATFVILATVVLATTSEGQIGIILATFGLGATAGAALASRVIRTLGLGRTMIVGLVIMGGGMSLLVFSSFGPLALLFGFTMFVGTGLVNVPIATIRQVYTPAAMLGRVITASRALSWGTLPIGALIGGGLAAQVDYRAIIRVTPVLLLGLALWLFSTPLWTDTFGPSHRRRSE
jgi:MFS family permease